MDMSVFSQLRWNFVYQRPQQIMGRMTKDYRVFYFEEADDINKEEYHQYRDDSKTNIAKEGSYHHYISEEGVHIIVPLLRGEDIHNVDMLKMIIERVFNTLKISEDIFWYYTPMAYDYTSSFNPNIVIYDCMDQLSAFKFAPDNLVSLEKELFLRADIVFTGGKSLYEDKKHKHEFVHCFPSSIDAKHFGKAKGELEDPFDQKSIAHPRAGYFGVVDERFDIELLRDVSMLLPQWSFVIVGPVVKIDSAALPQSENIHYLGIKKYDELPNYLSNWDVAIMPFALNESTEFISPTKTPEYLVAGKKVVSTAVHDVVHPYEDLGLVSIGRTSEEFAQNIEQSLDVTKEWLDDVEEYLKDFSWDNTCSQMNKIIKEMIVKKDSK